MPAVLVEIGYISNPLEDQKLSQDAGRQAVAQALARSILSFREKQARQAATP